MPVLQIESKLKPFLQRKLTLKRNILACALTLLACATTSSSTGTEVAFIGRNFTQRTAVGLEFPSNDYKICRTNAAADLKKIFFCTKKEWLRITNKISEQANVYVAKLSDIKYTIDSKREFLEGIVPKYYLSDVDYGMRGYVADLFDSQSVASETMFQKYTLEASFYKDDGSFEWEIFDYATETINRSLVTLEDLQNKLKKYAYISDRYASLINKIGFPKKIILNFSPSPTYEYTQMRKVVSGEASLKLDVKQKLVGVREYLITGISVAVSADNPTPLRLTLAVGKKGGATIGGPIGIDIVPNRVGGTFSRYTSKEWNDKRYKYLNLLFQSVDERVLRRINSRQWDGIVQLRVDFKSVNPDLDPGERMEIHDIRVHRIVLQVEYIPLSGQ
ncbi:hypothetical protein NKJ72_11330 [Mesorhizobium sp. M0045]|uniref:hypothetical protein n=1 Tax=Mesorhizobium sp. M0045 TaxID=2956857 RepID=UPI00333B9C84